MKYFWKVFLTIIYIEHTFSENSSDEGDNSLSNSSSSISPDLSSSVEKKTVMLLSEHTMTRI